MILNWFVYQEPREKEEDEMRTVLAVAGGKYKHNNNHKKKYPQTCLSNIQPYASTK